MAAINFQAQFADSILRGEKRQTIRKRGKSKPPSVGDTLQLYAGMRNAAKFMHVVCSSVEQINIMAEQGLVTMPRANFLGVATWNELTPDEIDDLARADGFSDAVAFFAFFREQYGSSFSGYLIKW